MTDKETGGKALPSDLARLRDGWEAVKAYKTQSLRQMSIQESLRHLLNLHRAFEPQLRQTEALFRADRLAHLEELQQRLSMLDASRE